MLGMPPTEEEEEEEEKKKKPSIHYSNTVVSRSCATGQTVMVRTRPFQVGPLT